MMKKRLLILLIPMLVISCGDDFTLLSPISERNMENFYETPTDFEAAIVGAYDALQSNGTFGVNYVLFMEMRADNGQNAGGATGAAETLQQIDDFKEISTAGQLKATWAESYEGISRANSILSRIDEVNFPDENLKKRIKGEALFIRSLFYYHLSVIFGNIPEQLDEVTSLNYEINQVPASTIYTKIAADLTEAEGLLPETTSNGRITSGAAAALLGRVYLQAGKKAEAEAPLRRVMTSAANYELVDDYQDLWGIDNKLNKESIFEIQYKSGTTEGSSYTDMYTPNGKGGGVGGGVSPVSPTSDVIDLFSDAALLGDERAAGTIAVDTTDNSNYVGKFDSHPSVKFDADNNWVEIRYAEVLLNLAEALGEGTEAYGFINEVRNRAGLTDIDASTPGTFEEKLLNERRLEFAFENKRWADLLRFGKAKEVMAAHLGISEADVKLLFPIPLGEIDVSPDKMTQNPEHN